MKKRDSVRKVGPYLKKGESNLKRKLGKKSRTLFAKVGLTKRTWTLS